MANYVIEPNTGYWFGANKFKAGDQILFKAGQHAYFSGTDCSGTEEAPIKATFEKGVQFNKGVSLTNCKWWIFDGGDEQNFVVKNASGVALSFKGKCANVAINGVRVEDAYSFIWYKTECNEPDFANWNYWIKNPDGTISPSYVMDGLTLTNFTFLKCNFDGGYFGTTGQKNDRPVTIDSVTYYPDSIKVANIRISDGVVDDSARTGIQISGLNESNSFIKNVTISNSGREKNAYQGASFRLGGNCVGHFEIEGCTFDSSYIYNVHIMCGRSLKFHNNTVNNSCMLGGIPNVQKMAAIQIDTFQAIPAMIDVQGNTVDDSNNGVSLVVYGNNKSLLPDSIVAGNNFQGSFQNQTGVQIIEDNTPPEPPVVVDKIVTYFLQVNSDKTKLKFFYTDNTNEIVSNVLKVLYQSKSGNYTVTFKDGTQKIMGKMTAADVREMTIEEFKNKIGNLIDFLMA